MSRPAGRWYAVAGAVAGIAGIGVSELLTHVLKTRATPVQAVAEAIIEVTPGALAESLIQLVGTWDKPILVAGVVAGVVGFAALAGLLSRRSPLEATTLFAAMGAVAFAATLTRPGFTVLAVVPVLAGVVAWMATLALLTRRLPAAGPAAGGEPGPVDPAGRRSFLLASAGVAVVALGLVAAGRLLGRDLRAVETARRLLRLPATEGEQPEGAELDVRGLEPWRSPNADFYRIDTALVLPVVDPGEWRLRVHGLVERELTLTYDDLLAREVTEAWVTLCCVSNPVGGELIGNAWWSGVRVADVLAEAGVLPGADAVLQTSSDGWDCGTPLEALTDDRNALLAVAMNGEPLPVEHGFPVRMVVPGLYGFVSATKWLVDLEVTRFGDIEAYWTQRGWAERGPVKTQSRIEVPRSGSDVPAGQVRVGGHAWAQHTGIEAVECRVDEGPWQRAELGGVPNDDTWVQWAHTVELAPGEHRIWVRATDRSGTTQTPERTDVVPDGATGWHSVEVTAT